MPDMIDEPDDYLDFWMNDVFSKTEFSMYREEFFWKNAIEFLDFKTYLSRIKSIADRADVMSYAGSIEMRYKSLIN